MSSNDKKPSGQVSRKERRAAERAARKSGGGSAKSSGSAKSKGSGGSSGPSIAIISVGAVAIGIVLVVALLLVSGGLGEDVAAVEEPDSPAPAAELRDGLTLVAEGAAPPVTIEIFEDVQCPHCQTFTETVEPLIIAEHVVPGRASLTYNDYIIFGEQSNDAAVAMRAADELGDAFWDYHHTLYHNAEDGDFSRSWLADIAESIGLDRDEFLALLDDDELQAGVADSMALASSYGISSTPSVVVNGELIGTPTWDELDAAVKAAAGTAS
jgi:protein-disulfide isomerase